VIRRTGLDDRYLWDDNRPIKFVAEGIQQRDSGTELHHLAAVDARLARLCAAWSSLPEHVSLAFLALVDSGGVWRRFASDPRPETPSVQCR
jgi:hypothetical protein